MIDHPTKDLYHFSFLYFSQRTCSSAQVRRLADKNEKQYLPIAFRGSWV